MNESRLQKYRRKFGYIIERISNLPEERPNDIYYWDALFYRLHTAIQALMDVISMICKDMGHDVVDDYSNISNLQSIELFSEDDIAELKSLNGLRNILVHRYNHIETDLIASEKEKIIRDIKDYLSKLEEIVSDF